MEAKKTTQADLSNKSFLFFNIGLIISLLAAITAFNYKVYDNTKLKDLAQNHVVQEDIAEVPLTDLPPPPPPRIEQPQIIEVPNEKKIEKIIEINMDVETNINQIYEAVELRPVVVEEKEEEDPHQIFIVVEESAAPIGGITAFYDFVKDKLKYPAQARRMRIEGKVFVEFVVEKDGTISDVRSIKGIGGGCDEEAVRVVENAPKWKPAKQRGKAVRQRMVLPLTFKMAE